jgi:mono/diheme cytochrome c family protein
MRVHIGRIVRGMGAALLIVAAPVAFGQDSPTAGKALFEGNSVQPCTSCHGTVQNRRDAIDQGGDLDFDLVLGAFLNAISMQSAMNQFNNGLTTQQKRDIAAYIADVPKARPNMVDFSATNTGNETTPQIITFNNAETATSSLTINTIGVTGSSADFIIKTNGTMCGNAQTLVPSGTCSVSVSFLTSTASTKVALLHFLYSQAGVTTDRTAQLSGTVANQPPPSSAMPSGGGGGAFGAGWVGLLLLATGLRRSAGRDEKAT